MAFERTLKPLPPNPFSPPSPYFRSPSDLLALFDRIRRELDSEDEFAEFCWFAREYPRCYRHHLSCAAHRLESVYRGYETAFARLLPEIATASDDFISTSYDDSTTHAIYWDFESFLSSVSSALDLLARIVGTAYKEHVPVSFSKLCKRPDLVGPALRLRTAQRVWAGRMKEYRDCFTHYTPVDTILAIAAQPRRDGWHVWGKIPANPHARDITRFRPSRRTDVLRYSLLVWRRAQALERAVTTDIARLYRKKEFPKRHQNLFTVGWQQN